MRTGEREENNIFFIDRINNRIRKPSNINKELLFLREKPKLKHRCESVSICHISGAIFMTHF